MEKNISKKPKILRIIASLAIMLFSCTFLAGCWGMGMTTGSMNVAGGNGSDEKPEKEWGEYIPEMYGEENEAFVGVIAEYNNIDNDGFEPKFYDYYQTGLNTTTYGSLFYNKYADEYLYFNDVARRNITIMSEIIYRQLKFVYGPNLRTLSKIPCWNVGGCYFEPSLVSNIYNNENNLKYKNAMYGGYQLNAYDSSDNIVELKDVSDLDRINEIKYINEFRDGLQWKHPLTDNNVAGYTKSGDNSAYSVNDLHNAISNIFSTPFYCNCMEEFGESHVSVNDESFGFTTCRSMIKYYTEYEDFKDEGFDKEVEFISSTELTRNIAWNIIYYLTYHVIGWDLVVQSFDCYDIVFNGGTLQNYEKTNYVAFELYKGYNVTLYEMVFNLARLKMDNGKIVIDNNVEPFSYKDFDNCLFPAINNSTYIFYPNVNALYDTVTDNMKDDEDISYDSGEGELDLGVYPGMETKLKRLIFIPCITPNYGQEYVDFTEFMWSIANDIAFNLDVTITSSILVDSGDGGVPTIECLINESVFWETYETETGETGNVYLKKSNYGHLIIGEQPLNGYDQDTFQMEWATGKFAKTVNGEQVVLDHWKLGTYITADKKQAFLDSFGYGKDYYVPNSEDKSAPTERPIRKKKIGIMGLWNGVVDGSGTCYSSGLMAGAAPCGNLVEMKMNFYEADKTGDVPAAKPAKSSTALNLLEFYIFLGGNSEANKDPSNNGHNGGSGAAGGGGDIVMDQFD